MKLYLIGFLKGLGVLAIFVVIYVILRVIAIVLKLDAVAESLIGVYLLLGYLLGFYIVYKFKLEKYWNIFVLIIGTPSVPFLYAIKETQKKKGKIIIYPY